MDEGAPFEVDESIAEPGVAERFRNRLRRGRLSRAENPSSHLCVYFAAHDPERRLVFAGHHRKSGLWLVNGGHVERGESPMEAVRREIHEEWGLAFDDESIGSPRLLTITHTRRRAEVPCRLHYDIWYFVRVDSRAFSPDPAALDEEFLETGWLSEAQAGERITDRNTLRALALLSQSWTIPTDGGS